MILHALANGKHVYSEWPLGTGYSETKELHEAAEAAKLHAAIGLQLRGNRAAQRKGRIHSRASAHRPRTQS
ncbi:hypothetical protein HFO97_08555 [Rhizobium leguminosarum]|uniref:hypothetical protein n=1 Tax=Rhizobium leguminosarum TaxID=384 RepID=UPI0039657049|nr:hypothetical protein [Rhizobium leguminosarum]